MSVHWSIRQSVTPLLFCHFELLPNPPKGRGAHCPYPVPHDLCPCPMIFAPAQWVPPLPNHTRRAGNRPYLKIILILGTFDHLRKLHYYHSQLSVATLCHAAVGSRGIVGQIHEGQKDNIPRTPANINLTGKSGCSFGNF